MKKKHLFRYLCMLLSCCMLLGCATACGKPAEDTAQTTAATTTASTESTTEAAAPWGLLDEQGQPRYVVIRPENVSDVVISAAIAMHTTLNDMTSTTFTLSDDFYGHDLSETQLAQTYEILIGETDRPQSAQHREGLATNEYVIDIGEYKITIVGGSDAATYQGVQAFLAMLETAQGVLPVQGTHLKQEMESSGYLVALTNQSQSMLEVYDISSGVLDDSTRVWSYELPYNPAGIKLRHSEQYGDVALAAYGSGWGCMISYPEGKMLWSTKMAANNPHSIELIPSGVIAIASSTGGEIRFFALSNSNSYAIDARVTLADAHGVLWDEQNQVLWAIGRTVLTAYSVTLNADNTVTVTEDTARRYTIPTDHAHDLAPVYGNTDALWITSGSQVYQFDKTTGTFSTDYSGAEHLNRANVKGVGNFPDGSLVYLYPDGEFLEWTTKSIVLVRNTGEKMAKEELTSQTDHFYKARVWCADYQ